MRTFDRTKPYQEIFGNDPDIPYRYIQGGAYFDDMGREVKPRTAAGQAGVVPESVRNEIYEKAKAEAKAQAEAEMQAEIDRRVQEALAKQKDTGEAGDAIDLIKNEPKATGKGKK